MSEKMGWVMYIVDTARQVEMHAIAIFPIKAGIFTVFRERFMTLLIK
jgi:hypothetical protein